MGLNKVEPVITESGIYCSYSIHLKDGDFYSRHMLTIYRTGQWIEKPIKGFIKCFFSRYTGDLNSIEFELLESELDNNVVHVIKGYENKYIYDIKYSSISLSLMELFNIMNGHNDKKAKKAIEHFLLKYVPNCGCKMYLLTPVEDDDEYDDDEFV